MTSRSPLRNAFDARQFDFYTPSVCFSIEELCDGTQDTGEMDVKAQSPLHGASLGRRKYPIDPPGCR
jgi:hypothetical protein